MKEDYTIDALKEFISYTQKELQDFSKLFDKYLKLYPEYIDPRHVAMVKTKFEEAELLMTRVVIDGDK